ncbi:MAG: hypothetical protein K0Q93_29 [Nocardioidaceae bacterium]|nr:hypothetical protein [Nocardioidaceae bacterium]
MAEPPVAPAPPVERFRSTAGHLLGWVGIAGFALLAAESASRSWSLPGLATCAVLVWAATVMWVGLVRPSVLAYGDHLLLRSAFRDTVVPWHLIDGIAVRLVLRLHVGDEVLQTGAVSRRARSLAPGGGGAGGSGPMLGGVVDRLSVAAPDHATVDHPQYPQYVEMRLRELASQRAEASRSRPAVQRSWARVPTAAFAVSSSVAAGLLGAAALLS